MLARAVVGQILLAITRHVTSVSPAFPHRLRTHQQAEEHSNTPG